MNLLPVGAAYGIIVVVNQKGARTIEARLPLFLFPILFGLSMDDHVFSLSRIRERSIIRTTTRNSWHMDCARRAD